MMQNHVIYSDDPQAVEKLQAKLDKLTAMHARMKEINAYFRKHATALGCPGLSDEDAAKLDRRVQEGYSWEKQPYPSYVLSGNTAEMRRLRQRIEEVSRTQSTEYVGWDFPGGHAEADGANLRLDVAHRVKDGHAVGHASARAVDVHGDIGVRSSISRKSSWATMLLASASFTSPRRKTTRSFSRRE